MSLITITNENVQEIKERETAVVEFWAPWCGYCKRLAPVLKQIAAQHEEVDILQVNIDDFEALAETYAIETIPTLVVLHKGKAEETLVAPQAKNLITDYLKTHKLIA